MKKFRSLVWFGVIALTLSSAGLVGCSDEDDNGGGGGGGSNANIPDGEKWIVTCTGETEFTNSSAIVSVGNEDSDDVILGLNAGDDISSFFMSSGVSEGTTGTFALDSAQVLIDNTTSYEGGADNGTSFSLTITEWDTEDFFSNGPAGTFEGDLNSVDTEGTISCSGTFDFNATPAFPTGD